MVFSKVKLISADVHGLRERRTRPPTARLLRRITWRITGDVEVDYCKTDSMLNFPFADNLSPQVGQVLFPNYGANALAISIHNILLHSGLGSAAARANVQSWTRSVSTSARSARRLTIPIGSA